MALSLFLCSPELIWDGIFHICSVALDFYQNTIYMFIYCIYIYTYIYKYELAKLLKKQTNHWLLHLHSPHSIHFLCIYAKSLGTVLTNIVKKEIISLKTSSAFS